MTALRALARLITNLADRIRGDGDLCRRCWTHRAGPHELLCGRCRDGQHPSTTTRKAT